MAQYDAWLDGRWIGMSEGETPAEARKLISESFPLISPSRIKLTPFMGLGKSDETFKALMGHPPLVPTSYPSTAK